MFDILGTRVYIYYLYFLRCLDRTTGQHKRCALLRYCLHIKFIFSFLNAHIPFLLEYLSKRIRKRISSSYMHYPAALYITERFLAFFRIILLPFHVTQSFHCGWLFILYLSEQVWHFAAMSNAFGYCTFCPYASTTEEVGKVFSVFSPIALF